MMRRSSIQPAPAHEPTRGRAGRRAAWRTAWLPVLVLVLVVGVPSVAGAQQPAAPLGRLRAELTGSEVRPAPGARGASARLVVDLHATQACWEISWTGVAPTAAHVHRGRAGQVGPVAFGLFQVRNPLATQGVREGCTGASTGLLRQLSQDPEGVYAQLRSRQHPGGAVRGQLRREGQLPNTGPELTLPSPLTQVLLVLLLGGAPLLGPLVDRYQQLARRDEAAGAHQPPRAGAAARCLAG